MLIQALFPNIGALTIGILSMYLVGSILGVDVFKGIMRKDFNAYLFFTIGAIGLGSVIFYVGIFMGFWDYYIFDQLAYWNTIFAVGFIILAIVFLIAGNFFLALILSLVLFFYFTGPSGSSILYYFIDPFVFIFTLIGFLFQWVTGNSNDLETKKKLAKKIKDGMESVEKYNKDYRGIKDYDSRVYDIIHQSLIDNQKKWKKKFRDENYEDYWK